MKELLTEDEHRALDLTAELANLIVTIIARGNIREDDVNEAVFHIHALQRMIGSQAAARAYPERYRLLGGVVSFVPDRG